MRQFDYEPLRCAHVVRTPPCIADRTHPLPQQPGLLCVADSVVAKYSRRFPPLYYNQAPKGLTTVRLLAPISIYKTDRKP